jgi:hypothetical protein
VSRWPLMVRGLVIGVCGFLLGLGGCLGFLATMESAEALAYVGAAAFFIGLLVILVGGIIFIIGVFKWLFSQFATPSQPPQP